MSMNGAYTPLIASAFAAVLGAQPAAAATLTDDFNGPAGAPNPASWVTSATNGNATVRVDGSSHLVANTVIPNPSQRAFALTQESGFDAFTAPLRIELTDIAVGGSVGSGAFNSGYVVFGRAAANATASYYPNGGAMAYGLAVNVKKIGANYILHVNEYSDNDTDSNPSDGTVLYADHPLAGVPTGLAIVIDGANKTVTLEVTGTTFTSNGAASSTQALSAHFTAANMTDGGALLSRVSVGAMNGGAVETGSFFSVGAIDVAPVPEPASLGLMGLGLMLGLARNRR